MTGQKGSIKNLYKGIFDYPTGIIILRTQAYSQEQARVIFCNRLAKKHNVHVSSVLSRFNEKPNYEIIKEIEFKEVSHVDG